jgi:hypothetical protein
MRFVSLLTPFLAGCLLLGAPVLNEAGAATPAELRAHMQKHADAVISLEVVTDMKFSFGGQASERENKFDALATVIDPSGLAVTALSSIDPTAMYASMMEDEDSLSVRVKSIKYILGDGTEVEAGIALRDQELDLVYLKPLAPATEPFAHIELADAADPDVFDKLFVVVRTPSLNRRTISGMTGEVQAKIRLPRRYLITSSEIFTSGVGIPAFETESGKVVGIAAVYSASSAARSNRRNENAVGIIVPADQVQRVAQQAKDRATEAMDASASTEDTAEESAEESTTE